MRRAGALLIVGCGITLAAAPRAAAQEPIIRFAVGASQVDTASALAPGAAAAIPIRYYFPSAAYSPYESYGYAVRGLQFTLHFDPARVEVLAAQSNTYELNVTGSSAGAGAFTVNASYSGYYAGVYGQDVVPLRITARLLPGASDGAYLWIEPGPVTACYQSYYYWNCNGSYALNGLSAIGQVCHATQIWGDVDGNGQVESRDALITLSAAVGLAVSGFDLAHGDVDGDGLTNSRDALMMLSYAIALPSGSSTGINRTGVGIADACPGPTPPGETVIFKRDGATGAGLHRLDSTATTPVRLAGSSGLDDFPRLNAAGTDVVFKCDTLSYTEVCRADAADGQHRRMLGPGSGSGFPDWSPDGAKIAFLQSGYLSLMDSSGANRVFLGGSPTYGANGLGWSRDGTRLAYGSLPAGTTRTVTLDTTHAVTVLDPSVTDADQVRWSPDGANVLYSRWPEGSIWSVSATGGTPQRLVAFGGSRGFDVGPQGLLFTAEGPGGPGSGKAVWLLQGGPTGPIVRLTSPPAGSDDQNPSFRRNP